MDFATAFNAPVVRVIDDETISFSKMSPVDVAAFSAQLKAVKTERTNRLISQLKLTGMEAYNLLSEAEDSEFTINGIWAYAAQPKGGIDIIKASLKKSGKSVEEVERIVLKLDPADLEFIALEIAGWKRAVEPPKEKEVDPKTPEEARGFGS